jgi:molybdopterin converting factor small subunit
MSVTIEIPTAFRRFTNGAPKVDCSATTVAEALNELTARFPDLGRHVRDDQGQIRQFLNVYLNEEDIRFLGGESCTLKEGDRVLLVPSIAGGCESHLSPEHAGRGGEHRNISCIAVFYKYETSASHLRSRFPAPSGVSCACESGCFPLF